MDPLLDYNITEIKCKDRKSYARDSHGFELENNYFQNPSSEEESSSDAGSFTLSLGRKNNISSQQQLSKQPSATRSGRSLRHSPSPSNISPVRITTNPKKRLTFEMGSNEEGQKAAMDETVSDSEEKEEEDRVVVTKEVLPGSYTAIGVGPSPKRNLANKNKARSFDLGNFSDSSSEADEDVAGIKRSLLFRPVGRDTLLCLPKLSEYVKPRQKSSVSTKKQTQGPNDKRKRYNLNNTVIPANTKKRKKNIRIEPLAEESIAEVPDEDETSRAVKTQRNPKLTKKRSTSSASIKQSKKQRPGSPRELKQQKQKPVAKRTSAHRRVHQPTMSPVSDSSQKSFAVLQNTTTKIIDSIYNNNDEQDLEENMAAEVEQSVQQCKDQPSISFTSRGEEIRQVRSNRENKPALDPLVSADERSDTFHLARKQCLATEAEGEHLQKKKKKDAAQKPPTVNKSKGHKNKEKRKDASRNAKRKKLIDESKSRHHDQGYVHIPVAKVEANSLDNTLRRSTRTRVPVINHLLGEQLIYEASASGGMIVKEVIRPATSAYQQLTKPSRKHQKHSSKNTMQLLKSNSTVQEAIKKKHKRQELSIDDTEQHTDKMTGDEEGSKPLKSHSRVQEAKKKKHKRQKSSVDDTEQRADEMAEDAKNIASLLVSPKRNETFGNSLMKSMFETTTSLATEVVEIINDDGTTRPPVEVVKPLQSLRLCNAAGSAVTPSDPFIMAILSRQKNTNFGVAVLNKMGDKGEQYTEDSSVCFFLISGEIIVKIGDLELHPPVWSRIFVPEGISYTLKNLQHTPAVLVYVVIKPNRDND